MKDINSYIVEKLRINDNTKLYDDAKDKKKIIADVIRNYLQKTLGLETTEYITDLTPDTYVGLYFPKGNYDTNIVGDSIYQLIKSFCTKKFEAERKSIYFYYK